MEFYICYLFLASAAYIVNAVDIPDGLYMLLPFMGNSEANTTCPLNEFYKFCTGNCSDCNRRGNCRITKCLEGCDCVPHFFRLEPNGPCEPVFNCPKTECGENEVFRECGPVCQRCLAYKCDIIRCEHKCYCKQGYLENEEGKCVPEKECPKRMRCSRNEQWLESGPVKESCFHSNDETSGPEIQEIPSCYCKEGFKRNGLGHCINETFCSSIRCFGVEVFYDCIPKCNTTCRNFGDTNCTDDGNCYPGCFCPSGYVMNDFRGCIPIEDCSLELMHVVLKESSEITEKFESSSDENSTTPMLDETGFLNTTSTKTLDEETNTTSTTTLDREMNTTPTTTKDGEINTTPTLDGEINTTPTTTLDGEINTTPTTTLDVSSTMIVKNISISPTESESQSTNFSEVKTNTSSDFSELDIESSDITESENEQVVTTAEITSEATSLEDDFDFDNTEM